MLTFMIFHLEMLNYQLKSKVVGNDSCLQLTHLVSSSAGRVMYKQPIKLFEGNPGNLGMFDNNLPGLYLGFKKNSPKFVVEFDTRRDAKHGDLSDNHVGIDAGGFVSVEVRNISSIMYKGSSLWRTQ